jgi:hypothetical protein
MGTRKNEKWLLPQGSNHSFVPLLVLVVVVLVAILLWLLTAALLLRLPFDGDPRGCHVAIDVELPILQPSQRIFCADKSVGLVRVVHASRHDLPQVVRGQCCGVAVRFPTE